MAAFNSGTSPKAAKLDATDSVVLRPAEGGVQPADKAPNQHRALSLRMSAGARLTSTAGGGQPCCLVRQHPRGTARYLLIGTAALVESLFDC